MTSHTLMPAQAGLPLDDKALIAWAERDRSEGELAELETALHSNTTYSQGAIRRAFGKLLGHYLRKTQIDTRDTERLGKLIGCDWQEQERELPYDPLLVQSWLDGEYLPRRTAWEAIFEYFATPGNTIPQAQLDLMELLYDSAEDNRLREWQTTMREMAGQLGEKSLSGLARIIAEHAGFGHHYARSIIYYAWKIPESIVDRLTDFLSFKEVSAECIATFRTLCERNRVQDKSTTYPKISELQETAKLRIASNIISQDEIIEAFKSKLNGGKNYNAAYLRNRTDGKCAFTLDEVKVIDQLCHEKGHDCQPALSELYWHQIAQQAAEAWQAAEGFGPMLRALRLSVDLSTREMAASAGVLYTQFNMWENAGPGKQTNNRPTSSQLDQLIQRLQAEERALETDYPRTFRPLDDPQRYQKLRAAHEKFRAGKRDYATTTVPWKQHPQLLEEIAALNLSGWNAFSIASLSGKLIGDASPGGLDTLTTNQIESALVLCRNKWGKGGYPKLQPDQREAALERLSGKLESLEPPNRGPNSFRGRLSPPRMGELAPASGRGR